MGMAVCDFCQLNKIFICPSCLFAALKDKRKASVTITASKSSIHLTGIKFKDAGVYKCLRYNKKVSTKRYKVIVIGE